MTTPLLLTRICIWLYFSVVKDVAYVKIKLHHECFSHALWLFHWGWVYLDALVLPNHTGEKVGDKGNIQINYSSWKEIPSSLHCVLVCENPHVIFFRLCKWWSFFNLLLIVKSCGGCPYTELTPKTVYVHLGHLTSLYPQNRGTWVWGSPPEDDATIRWIPFKNAIH